MTPMKSDPTFSYVRFPCYLTERQKCLLEEISKERGDSITELLREAVHYWLKAKGKDDGLLYSVEETIEAYMKERERMREAAISRKEMLQEKEGSQ